MTRYGEDIRWRPTPGVTPRGKTVLKAFEYQDVRLLPGMLLTQVDSAPTLFFNLGEASRAFVTKRDN